ncbi:uncharacterized protein METZ01_LOCUS514929, partial [marine metagenome]
QLLSSEVKNLLEVYRLFLLSHCPFSLIYYAFGV